MKKRLLISIALFLTTFLFSPAVRAQTYGLPQTGQETIYHPPAINDLGGDGATRAGYPPGSRRALAFQDNYCKTVTDDASGLMWQKKDSGGEEFGKLSGMVTWENAFKYVAAMNAARYAGYTDWRVPNAKELLSIVNRENYLPAVYYIFDGMTGNPYWASSSVESWQIQQAIYVNFDDGLLGYMTPDSCHFAYIKAVRSNNFSQGTEGFPRTGQTIPYHNAAPPYDLGDDGVTQTGYPATGNSFIDNGDTVTQRATGLIWQKTDSQTKPFGNYSGALTWEEAFAYVAEMNKQAFARYHDWRVPNYFELAGLTDLGESHPIIDPIFREYTQTDDFYWSGTSRSHTISEAMVVHFANAFSSVPAKTMRYYVRAVRAGPYIHPTPAPAYPTPIPDPRYLHGLAKTGQTNTYHPAGEYDLGDDGVTRVGYPLINLRFGSDTQKVTDYATGLVWQRAESGSQPFGSLSGQLTWEQAFDYVAEMNRQYFAGYNDWRVPNIKELFSIVDFGRWQPAIDTGHFNIGMTEQDQIFWGGTIYPDIIVGRCSYQVAFSEGILQWINIDAVPPPTCCVRAVRSLVPEAGAPGFPKTGQVVIFHYPSGYDLGDDGAIQAGYPAAGARFVDKGNGTVLDKATGLIWQKADSAYQKVGSYGDSLNWEDAFKYIREMNIRRVSGYTTWRLPNIEELQSLINFRQFDPALDPIFNKYNQSGYHWSSTSRCRDTIWHWATYFWQGASTFNSGTELCYVKGVLGGAGLAPGPTITTPIPTPPGRRTPSPIPTFPPARGTPTAPDYKHLYYGIPKTGQTDIYHSGNGNDLGDDGVTQVGYPAEPPRWEDMGNGVVIDWATGLMWQQSECHGQPFGGLSGTMTWEEAFRYVKAMNQSKFGGFADWRVPNCLELLSLRNLSNNCTTPSVFIDTSYDYYWTSTGSADSSSETKIFAVNPRPGHMLLKDAADYRAAVRACRTFYHGISPRGFPKTGQTKVIHPADGYDKGDDGAARAGFPTAGPRFEDNDNGTVTDNATGLTWQKGCSFQPYSWTDAFAYVSSLNQEYFAGCSDWRLPNQMELFSIVDYGKYNPMIDNDYFSDTQSNNYWSSNTNVDTLLNAWYVNFCDGFGDQGPKRNTNYVRAVRGNVIFGPRPTPTPRRLVLASGDYNGDGTSDIAIFRSSSKLWAIRRITRFYFGSGEDIPVNGDYNGNGTTEIGVFRPNSGLWAIRGVTRVYFGSPIDISVPGDYNGDGCCDMGIWRGGSGLWAIRSVSRAYFGGGSAQPMPGDYNGDGTGDIGIFKGNCGLWALRSISRFYFGGHTDTAILGDYDGDGTWETGIFRPAAGLWAIRGVTRAYFGSGSDQPIPADYVGWGKDAIGIFRGHCGLWAIRGVTRAYFGTIGDTPITR